jgi:hypothetical protein
MTGVDEPFARAEQEHARVVARLAAGEITYEQAQQALDGLVVEHGGRLWTIGADTGGWYVHDGRGWVQATPPAARSGPVAPQPHTPYPQYHPQSETRTRRGGFGPGQMVLAAAAAAILAVAVLAVLWLVFRPDRGPTGETIDAASPSVSGTPTTSAIGTLPGTDGQGFLEYPFARCDAGDVPELMARTTKTVLVICRSGPTYLYYRFVRISDGGGMELGDAVRTSGGFDVLNPADQTVHEVRPTALSIRRPDGQVFSEPMVGYAP